MKKNFFKKLSFVMALAMIVTALAPAAGVFAAAAPKLNAKKVYIHVAEKTTEFDFNIKNKKSGWKYAWKSSNENVAEVASNGLVTAVGKGTATISVAIKNNKGEKVDTLKATVVVRDNIKKLTITNTPAGDKLAVGEKRDFNRSYVTASGNKKATSGITRWAVDKTGATIVANSGVFTSTEAGTYTITARAFQSTAKYESWLADSAKYASYVTATATYTVKVAPSIVKAEQVDLNTVKVTFDSPVTDVATKLTVAQVVSGTEVVASIDTVSMDADNKVATVDMTYDFAQEFVYKVKYPEMTDVQFTAAKVDPTLVTSIAVKTTTAQEGRGTDIDVALYNKDMVNIADSTLLQRVTIETSATNSSASGRTLYLYNKGTTTTVKATYHTYTYDTAGVETGVLTASGVVTCVAWADYTLNTIKAYSINDTAPDWVTVNHGLAVDDAGQKIWVKLKGTKYDGSSVEYVNNHSDISAGIKFSSSNNNILVVNETTGDLTAISAGSASILVKYNDAVVGAVTVTVKGKRAVASVSLSTSNLTLSKKFSDVKTVNVTVKDQFGDKLDPSTYELSYAESNTSSGITDAKIDGTSKDDQGKITIDANGATTGTYTYTVKIKDKNTQTEVPAYLIVTVNDVTVPGGATNFGYVIEVGAQQYDMKVSSSDKYEDATFSVYKTYSGVKVEKLDITTTPGATPYVKFEKNSEDKTSALTLSGDLKTATFNLVDSAAKLALGTSVPVSKQATGSYQIKLIKDNTSNQVLTSSIFNVVDSQPKLVYTINKTAIDIEGTVSGKADVITGLKECMDISLEGKNVEADIYDIVYTPAGTDQYVISKILIKQELETGKAFVKHEISQNISLNIK